MVGQRLWHDGKKLQYLPLLHPCPLHLRHGLPSSSHHLPEAQAPLTFSPHEAFALSLYFPQGLLSSWGSAGRVVSEGP